MSLGAFLDAAYAVLIEEYRRLGSDLQSALAEMEMWRAGGPAGERPQSVSTITPEQEYARSERATALANQKSLAELQKMMAGVSLG
jgi:hypothetical protein